MGKEKLSDWKTGQYLIFLLGNKLDLIDIEDKKREVTEDEAENFCEDNKIEQQFIKHGDTFFNSYILDYVE